MTSDSHARRKLVAHNRRLAKEAGYRVAEMQFGDADGIALRWFYVEPGAQAAPFGRGFSSRGAAWAAAVAHGVQAGLIKPEGVPDASA